MAFLAAKAAGEEVVLGPYLVGRGLVSVSVLLQLSAEAQDVSKEDVSEELAQAGFALADDSSSAEVPLPPDESAGERVRLIDPSSDDDDLSDETDPRGARALDPSEQTDEVTRAAEASVSARARRRREEQRRPPSREESGAHLRALARASSGVHPVPSPESPLEASDLPDVETRRIDLEALAAASARPQVRSWLPIVVVAAVVVVLGLGVWHLREPTSVTPPTGSEVENPFPDVVPDGGDPAPVASDLTIPAVNRLAEAEEAARLLERKEDYAGALAKYSALPSEVRRNDRAVIDAAESRLRALLRYRREADRLLGEVEPLRKIERKLPASRKQLEAGLGRLEAFLARDATLARSATGQRLKDLLFELTLVWEEARTGNQPTRTRRTQPPERAERMRSAAERGLSTVKLMRMAIAKKKAELLRELEAELKRAQEVSRKRPFDLRLDGRRLRRAVLIRFDERGIVVESGGQRVGAEWRRLVQADWRQALAIRSLPVRDDVARDHLRLGRWALEHRLFETARQAFGRAILLDARLKDRVPDVTELARASRVFKGSAAVDRARGTLTLKYAFQRSNEIGDWEFRRDVRGGVNTKQDRLEVKGKGVALGALKETGFEDWIEVHFTPGPAQRGAAVGVGLAFNAGTRREVTYLAALHRSRSEILLGRLRGRRLEVIERRRGPSWGRNKNPRLTLELQKDRLRVKKGARTVFRATVSEGFDKLRVVVASLSNNRGGASFQEIEVQGRVRPAWVRKAFGEFDDRLRAFLARTTDLSLFARPPGRKPIKKLSAEDAFGMSGVKKAALAAYERGREKAAAGTPLDLLAAANAYGKAVELQPTFAAAYYRRALVLEALGRPRLAVSELERAEEHCPAFFEALSERARLLALGGELGPAEAAAEAALALRPDHAPAISALARVRFQQGRLKEALAGLDLALAIDPWDSTVRSFRRNVTNVIQGPPWEERHTRETEHYVVKTDISKARCDEYARDLEVVRSHYVRLFGDATATKGERKASVLIFDTREGFHAYAELTTDDRVESLLGCYLPRYRQLLLYEDKDDATLTETRRVLYHEAFHQFIEGVIPGLPFWLNEGFADYVSTTRIEQGRVVQQGGVVPARLKDLRRFVKSNGGPLPFRQIMQESPARFYSGPVAAKYAQAWSMVHFFQRGAADGIRARFKTYVEALRSGLGSRRAFQKAWDGVAWETVQKAWWEHVQKL